MHLRLLSPLVLLLAATTHAQVLYGHGTPGSSGTPPRLTSARPFAGNAVFDYRVDRGLPNAPAALLVSTAPDAVTVAGSQVWIDLAPGRFLFSAPLALDASGSGRLAGGLGGAGSTSLIGLRFHLQAIVADVPPSGAIVATTNGLELEVTEPPLLFIGADASRTGPDPFVLLDPTTLAPRFLGAAPSSDSVTGAVFAEGGRRLFTASSERNSIERADTTTTPPTWSTFTQLTAPALGVAIDRRHQRLYTVSGPIVGPKDLVVIDADPLSPGYGTEIARVPAVTELTSARQWSLSTTGDRLAMYAGDARAGELLILDTDPSRVTYLRIVDRTPVPDLLPPFNALNELRTTGDGRVVLAVLTIGFVSVPSGVHRYDTATRQWLDHNPAWPGLQPIGTRSSPPGPVLSSTDLGLARDDSFATLTDYDTLVRIDFDRDDPTVWNLVNVPAGWTWSTSFGHTVTADGGHVLVLRPSSQSLLDSDAMVVDVRTGQVVASRLLQGIPWIGVFAER